jgi:hypothetical protein
MRVLIGVGGDGRVCALCCEGSQRVRNLKSDSASEPQSLRGCEREEDDARANPSAKRQVGKTRARDLTEDTNSEQLLPEQQRDRARELLVLFLRTNTREESGVT